MAALGLCSWVLDHMAERRHNRDRLIKPIRPDPPPANPAVATPWWLVASGLGSS
jgi:hypothetical protein